MTQATADITAAAADLFEKQTVELVGASHSGRQQLYSALISVAPDVLAAQAFVAAESITHDGVEILMLPPRGQEGRAPVSVGWLPATSMRTGQKQHRDRVDPDSICAWWRRYARTKGFAVGAGGEYIGARWQIAEFVDATTLDRPTKLRVRLLGGV